MIHPDDIAAWLAQVRQNPEAAPGIIEALAARLIELDRQNEALRDELLRLRQTGATAADPGQVATLTRQVQALERQLARSAPGGPGEVVRSLLVFTLDGRGARLSLPDAKDWQEREDPALLAAHLRPRHLLIAAEGDDLLLITDKGRAMQMTVADIDAAEAPVHYVSLLPDVVLDLDESVSVILPLPQDFGQLTLVTRKGYARSFRRAEVHNLLERNLPLHSSPVEGDYPAYAAIGDGQGELLVVTRGGKGIRFPERSVGVQAKPAIRLDRGDVVIGTVGVTDGTRVLVVGADGHAARREMQGFGAHPSAGHRGKWVTRIDNLVAAAAVVQEDTLWLLTAGGKLNAVPAARAPSGPGASGGRAIVEPGRDRLVALAVS